MCIRDSPLDALPVEDWLDLLRPQGYDKVEYGYCMMPDGTGYIANYSVLPNSVTTQMRM